MGEAVITSVIGMHRSGTSLLASMLAMCGIYPGPEEKLMQSTVKDDNPYGYWEYLPFVVGLSLRIFTKGFNGSKIRDLSFSEPS